MKPEQIYYWIQRLEATRIREFELEEDDCVLRLRFGGPAEMSIPPTVQVMESTCLPSTASTFIRAPEAGVFHAQHPLAGNGASDMQVRKGDIVGFLRVGEMMTGVIAPSDGLLCRPEIADGTLVGYGQPLFRIK